MDQIWRQGIDDHKIIFDFIEKECYAKSKNKKDDEKLFTIIQEASKSCQTLQTQLPKLIAIIPLVIQYFEEDSKSFFCLIDVSIKYDSFK